MTYHDEDDDDFSGIIELDESSIIKKSTPSLVDFSDEEKLLLSSFDDDIPLEDLAILEKLLQLKDIRVRFAMDHHVNTHNERMDFKNTPHIRDLYNSTAKVIVIQGSTQCFKSEWLIIDHLSCAYAGLSVFFVLPKIEHRNTYVQNRINRCIASVPEYKKIIATADSFDSVQIKQFGKGTVKYVGSNVFADFREFPADVLVVEEVDDCDPENLRYGYDRLMASKYKFERWIGNPKLSETGINEKFLTSDQNEWALPCINCGRHVELNWFEVCVKEVTDKEGNIIDYKLRDNEWSPEMKRDIYFLCPHCGDPLDRRSKEGMWIPHNPDSKIFGLHMSALCTPVNTVSWMWNKFKPCINNPTELQHFYNSILGLPFENTGSKLTKALLQSCALEGYNFVIDGDRGYVPDNCHHGPCSMGIDVGGMLDVRISYSTPEGKRLAVFIGKVPHIDDIHELIERYNVEVAVIDQDPETHLVREFKEKARCAAWSCKFKILHSRNFNESIRRHRALTPDRTEAMDMALAQLKRRKNLLPQNFDSLIGGRYVKEMCLPERVVEKTPSGDLRFIWTKTGDDHQRLCDLYDMLAWLMMQDEVLDVSVV